MSVKVRYSSYNDRFYLSLDIPSSGKYHTISGYTYQEAIKYTEACLDCGYEVNFKITRRPITKSSIVKAQDAQLLRELSAELTKLAQEKKVEAEIRALDDWEQEMFLRQYRYDCDLTDTL